MRLQQQDRAFCARKPSIDPAEMKIVYTILQKLPSESGGEPTYRIKAADEPHDRIVTEAELRDASHLENKS
jgi:hypothetical protein